MSLGSKDPVHVVISASDRKLPKQGQSVYLASSGYPFVLESRIEREEGNLANYKSNQIDFSAPDPINNDESEKIVAGVKAEYTSDALKVEPTLVVGISLISISLFIFFSSLFPQLFRSLTPVHPHQNQLLSLDFLNFLDFLNLLEFYDLLKFYDLNLQKFLYLLDQLAAF